MAGYDVIIVGAGPAGMTAGIYLARAGRKVVIIEAGVPGGQVFINHLVENYPGFSEPIAGSELAERMQKQVERLGVEIKNLPVSKLTKLKSGEFELEAFSQRLTSKAVILATGSKPKHLGIPGEESLFGAGVSYCSTCDGMFFKGKDVVVIGGGNSALHGAEYLERICKTVTLIHRRDEFRGDVLLVQRLKNDSNVKLMLGNNVYEVIGDKKVEGLKMRNVKTSQESTVKCDGVFIYVGSEPQNSLVQGLIDLDEYGYVITKPDMSTSLPGLYAAGDVVQKPFRQMVTAVSDGCIAALNADKYLTL
jgi:thioredoxin reductase (NADPH)